MMSCPIEPSTLVPRSGAASVAGATAEVVEAQVAAAPAVAGEAGVAGTACGEARCEPASWSACSTDPPTGMS